MPILDLTLPLTHKMPVYPGDPEVLIEEIHTLDKEGWRLRQLSLSTHIGTHINVPFHMVANGKTLSEYELSDFISESIVYTEKCEWDANIGLIFSSQKIDEAVAEKLVKNPPKFVGLSATFEFDIAIEKLLLEHNIISYENLANTEKLPSNFMFYGIPLDIPGADGSPVRSFAVIMD